MTLHGLSKAVDFGTNQKRVWDFLLVINSNTPSQTKFLGNFWVVPLE